MMLSQIELALLDDNDDDDDDDTKGDVANGTKDNYDG